MKLFIITVIIAASIIFTVDAYAFTLDEIQEKQAEQVMLSEELEVLKTDLEKNQIKIDEFASFRESLKTNIRVLKQADADDSKVFAIEVILSETTTKLREAKLERVALLDHQSTNKKKINSLNDDIRYNVVDLDESKVEFVSSDGINLQIDIADLQEQLDIYDQIEESIEEEIRLNREQIRDYEQTRDRYQKELDVVKEESKSSWAIIATRADAEKIVQSIDNIIEVWLIHEEELEDGRTQIIQERQTIKTVLEEAKVALAESKFSEIDQKHLVGLSISKTCVTLLRNDIPTNCPSYADLINLDSSNTDVSGEFVTEDDGWFHRGPSSYEESWRWYDYDDKIRLILDPPLTMSSRIPMVTIENNFGVYFAAGDHTINPVTLGNGIDSVGTYSDSKRTYHSSRHIDRCVEAVISADKWTTMLTDTIVMLRTGCVNTTVQDRFEEYIPRTEIDITTSPNWQYSQWVDAAKNSCKTICKQY